MSGSQMFLSLVEWLKTKDVLSKRIYDDGQFVVFKRYRRGAKSPYYDLYEYKKFLLGKIMIHRSWSLELHKIEQEVYRLRQPERDLQQMVECQGEKFLGKDLPHISNWRLKRGPLR